MPTTRPWLPFPLLLAAMAASGFGQVPGADTGSPADGSRSAAADRETLLQAIRQLPRVEADAKNAALLSRVPFANPPEIRSGNGLLHTTLVVDYANHEIPTVDDPSVSHRVRLRSFNSSLVGPTLRVSPGDVLSIRLINDLPDEKPKAAAPAHGDINDPPHDPNTTNLHTHGLHVSPEDNSDNVFLEVPPRGRQDFKFVIPGPAVPGTTSSAAKSPCPHPPGTHWYHPHKHGSVSIQVASGMSGALIVEGGLDEVPEIRAARELVFVFEQIPYSNDAVPGTVEGTEAIEAITAWTQNARRATTINGRLWPVIEMAPGEVQRWRFIHAGISEKLDVALRSVDEATSYPLHEIAADGIATGARHPKPSISLSPGNRSDVLVEAPMCPGQYLLFDLAAADAELLPMLREARRDAAEDVVEGALRAGTVEAKRPLAKIVVCGAPRPMSLPASAALSRYAPYPKLPPTTQPPRTLTFDGDDLDWKIDGRQFDPAVTSHCPKIGTVEQWTLFSQKDSHPFHIHVNPFEILSIKDRNGVEQLKPDDAVWRDTILLKNRHTIVFRTRFEDFPGKTVLHCHKLDHEDQGMMQMFRILPQCPSQDAGNTPTNDEPAPAASWRLPDATGRMHELRDFAGRPTVLVFFRGMGCLHCVRQLQTFIERRKDLEETGAALVAISSDTPEDLRAALDLYTEDKAMPFLLLADGEHHVFREYGCFEGQPMHGVFLIDEEGRRRWRRTGEEPLMDIDLVLDQCRRLRP